MTIRPSLAIEIEIGFAESVRVRRVSMAQAAVFSRIDRSI
jgi:hypothetical protein